MEETEALLANLVQTKSVEKALAPIAAQVSQLIILNEAYEQGDKDAFPSDLLPNATLVKKSTETLVTAGKQIMHQSADDELKRSMPRACDLLLASGENLVTATQRLHMEQFSAPSRRHLVRCAKDVLEATLKVMLVSDDSEVRKIVRSAHWVTERLGVLTAVRSIKQLVPAFKAFTESVMLFSNLVGVRQLDLVNAQRRDTVLTHMATLKKAVPMLSSAMQTYVKYPDNSKSKSSKQFAVGQVMECVEDITAVMENKPVVGEEEVEQEEPGHFVATIDKVLYQLNEEQRLSNAAVGSDLDLTLEAAIRHSMGVAHLSTEKHRSLIIKNCQRVLRQRSKASELSKSLRENPNFHELRRDFDYDCERLMDEFQDLEKHVGASVIQLSTDVYKETTEPADRLMKAALSTERVDSDLEPLIEAFHAHSDRMCQVARLAAAAADDSKKVRVIRGCVSQLEKLDPELVPAVLACRQQPSDKGAMEHLRLLKREWGNSVEVMVARLDEVTDARAFIQVSEFEMQHVVSRCKDSMYVDSPTLATYTRHLIGQARRVSSFSKRVVEESDDPLHRNALMVLINQLNKIISSVKSASTSVQHDSSQVQLHNKLHRRCDLLLKCVRKLIEGIENGVISDLLQSPEPKSTSSGWQGLRVLDFDGAADEVDDFKEEGWDKENVSGAVSLTPKSIPKPKVEENKKKQAIKSYIADVVSAPLSDLCRCVTSTAVSGRQQQLDLLCNDVLARTNHVTDLANSIASCIRDHEKKERLEEVAAEINALAPRLLDLSRKVCQCDTSAIDNMHDTADKWAKEVSYMETFIDSIIVRWKPVSDKVADAAKMCNKQLLIAQIENTNRHCKFVCDLASAGRKLVNPGDLLATEHAQLMQDGADEFENVSALMTTLADSVCSSGKEEEKRALELNSREWAARAYCICTQLDNLANRAILTISGRRLGQHREDFTEVNRDLKKYTEDTIRLKASVEMALESGACDREESELRKKVFDIDQLLTAMDEASQLLTHSTQAYMSVDELCAPHSLSLLCWQWSRKVGDLQSRLDSLMCEFTMPAERLLAALKAADREDNKDADTAIHEFQQRWIKSRSKINEALEGANDFDKKSQVRHCIEEMNSIMEQILNVVRAYQENAEDQSKEVEFHEVKRKWASTAHKLIHMLNALDGAKADAVSDASKQLKGFSMLGPKQVSAVLHSDSSPWWKKPADRRKVNFSTRADESKNMGATASHNLTIHDLTGSLIDFADDLLAYEIDFEDTCDIDPTETSQLDNDEDDEEADDTLVDKENTPKRGAGVQFDLKEEIGMSMWIEDDTETDDVVDSATKNPEKSYKELSRGPRVSHGTPSKPSSNSGYKMKAKGAVSNAGYTLPTEVDRWEDDNNAIVSVAKEISHQLQDMTDYTRQTGPITTRGELINTAKEIAKNGGKLVSFVKILAQYCVDQRCADDLQHYCQAVPTMIAQLHILATVKATSDDDRASEKQLVNTAENLVTSINKMLSSAEGACVRGFREAPVDALDESAALILATKWKRKLNQHRMIESHIADTDELGLRKINPNSGRPSLSQIQMSKQKVFV